MNFARPEAGTYVLFKCCYVDIAFTLVPSNCQRAVDTTHFRSRARDEQPLLAHGHIALVLDQSKRRMRSPGRAVWVQLPTVKRAPNPASTL